MERMSEEIETTTEAMVEAKKILQDTVNDMNAMTKVIYPQLEEQIHHIRSTRMTLTVESNQLLKQLEDVRKFFLDKNYEQEMQRTERFISMCNTLKELKKDGTLDAVSETLIRLMGEK